MQSLINLNHQIPACTDTMLCQHEHMDSLYLNWLRLHSNPAIAKRHGDTMNMHFLICRPMLTRHMWCSPGFHRRMKGFEIQCYWGEWLCCYRICILSVKFETLLELELENEDRYSPATWTWSHPSTILHSWTRWRGFVKRNQQMFVDLAQSFISHSPVYPIMCHLWPSTIQPFHINPYYHAEGLECNRCGSGTVIQ